MTSIVGITALQELRQFKGFEKAIIAGGFVRDSILGGSIKDLDIFVPCDHADGFKNLVEQHFKVGETDTPPAPKVIHVPENEFDAWFHELRIRTNTNPWNTHEFNVNRETRMMEIIERVFVKKPKVTPDIGNFKNLTFNKKEYDRGSPSYVGHYDCRFMDFLDVDIIGYKVKNIEKNFNGEVVTEFGKDLVSEFNYNIDKVYFDGVDTIQTEEFKRDFKNSEATLSLLADLHYLPLAMRKFERLREKYPQFAFRSTVLEIKKEEDNSHRKQRKSYDDYFKTVYAANPGAAPWAVRP